MLKCDGCRAYTLLGKCFGAVEELLAILQEDPHNRSGQHKIKKLAGLKPGDGQWRIRWRDYRLRYDIFCEAVVLHSFRHRREAY
jgi:mRNA-degrading endonuclease RelE of RelBE toxin-antitoxin system